MPRHPLPVAVAACLSFFGPPADPSAPAPTIRLGMSTSLTGPASHLGSSVRAGVEAAVAEQNADIKQSGRRIELVALDDGYEPSRAAPNMQALINDPSVVAIIGNVGTPTAVVSLPIATQAHIAFVGAYSGAAILRKNPPDPTVFNFRAGYAEEVTAMVDALISEAGLQPEQIAFFTQRDAYGDAGYKVGLQALHAKGLPQSTPPPQGCYDRNTDAVEGAVADMLGARHPPKAVIMVGTAAPTARFVKLMRSVGLNPLFLSISFVGSHHFVQAVGDDGEGVIITEVVPSPGADLPVNHQFRAVVAPEFRDNSSALEGYIVGRMVCRSIQSTSSVPSRESLLAALDRLGRFDLGLGVELELSPSHRQACASIWPVQIRAGRLCPMQWSDLRTTRDQHAPELHP